jgi:hypothetical protein
MPVDVNKLLDELGATGEERSQVEKFFAKPEVLAKASDWYENGLRQSDYSRRMDGLAATERARMAQIESEEKRLKDTFDSLNTQFSKAQQEREQAETKAAAMAARVKTLAAEWNIPEAEVGKILENQAPPAPSSAPPASSTSPAALDPAQFVSRKEYETLAAVALKLPQFAAAFPMMRDQHRALFGSVPDDFETKILEEARKQERPLPVIWDNLYGVEQKKKEVHDTQIRADERAKVEAEYKQKYSRGEVAPMTLQSPASPIFSLEPLNKNSRQARNRGVDESVQRAAQRFTENYGKRVSEGAA